jgi:hypothetical protein
MNDERDKYRQGVVSEMRSKSKEILEMRMDPGIDPWKPSGSSGTGKGVVRGSGGGKRCSRGGAPQTVVF